MLIYALVISAGFGWLYAETSFAHNGSIGQATTIGVLAFLTYAAGFLLPPLLFRYTNNDPAPVVMSAVIRRAFVAAIAALALAALTWFLVNRPSIALLEELYMYSLATILLVHGFGGAVASHVVYLQQTRQYNSNQLVAVLALVTLLLFVLLLYFLYFDFAFPRAAHIHIRDLTLVTLVLFAYGRAVFLMAHH